MNQSKAKHLRKKLQVRHPGRKGGGLVNPQKTGPSMPAPLFRGHAWERRSQHSKGQPKNAKQKLVVIDEKLKTEPAVSPLMQELLKLSSRCKGDRVAMIKRLQTKHNKDVLEIMCAELGYRVGRNRTKYDFAVALVVGVLG